MIIKFEDNDSLMTGKMNKGDKNFHNLVRKLNGREDMDVFYDGMKRIKSLLGGDCLSGNIVDKTDDKVEEKEMNNEFHKRNFNDNE